LGSIPPPAPGWSLRPECGASSPLWTEELEAPDPIPYARMQTLVLERSVRQHATLAEVAPPLPHGMLVLYPGPNMPRWPSPTRP